MEMALCRCVLLFAKAPEKGQVKTRLSTYLDEEITLNLYKCFVADVIEVLKKAGHPFKIAFHPPESGKEIILWLGEEHSYTPQVGVHLGERMKNAFRGAFLEGFSEVLVIGTDIPDLTPSLIDEALEALSGNNAVIGPCLDGGYYLIGFKKETFLPDIFRGIKWSTEGVFRETMAVFSHNGYKVHVLPKLRDIDRPEDLKAFYEESRKRKSRHSKTFSYLSSHGDILGYER